MTSSSPTRGWVGCIIGTRGAGQRSPGRVRPLVPGPWCVNQNLADHRRELRSSGNRPAICFGPRQGRVEAAALEPEPDNRNEVLVVAIALVEVGYPDVVGSSGRGVEHVLDEEWPVVYRQGIDVGRQAAEACSAEEVGDVVACSWDSSDIDHRTANVIVQIESFVYDMRGQTRARLSESASYLGEIRLCFLVGPPTGAPP